MSVAGTQRFSLRPEGKPLVLALLVSLAAHAVLVTGLILASAVILAAAKRNAIADLQQFHLASAKLPPTPQEPTLVFVEVNPAEIAPEAPKNPKYYSAQNAVAANTEAKADTDTPKIEGNQTHVPKAEATPRSKAVPLQPSAPKEPAPPEKVVEAKNEQKPGDLAMAKPAESKPEAPRQRPHTLAEVQQQPTTLSGERIKQDGGVRRRRLVPSFDTIGTAFGEYDARIIAAIQQHWYDLVDEKNVAREKTGRVVLEFRLNYDGRITDMKEVESDVGPILGYLCQRAVIDPGPYERWPADMRRLVQGDYREVRFTFFYE